MKKSPKLITRSGELTIITVIRIIAIIIFAVLAAVPTAIAIVIIIIIELILNQNSSLKTDLVAINTPIVRMVAFADIIKISIAMDSFRMAGFIKIKATNQLDFEQTNLAFIGLQLKENFHEVKQATHKLGIVPIVHKVGTIRAKDFGCVDPF